MNTAMLQFINLGIFFIEVKLLLVSRYSKLVRAHENNRTKSKLCLVLFFNLFLMTRITVNSPDQA